MTEQELYDVWTRWMHRNDIEEDLPVVFLFASSRVSERLYVSHSMDDILANHPRLLVHAGLIYLHQLARDGEGQDNELRLFESAVTDYSQYKSKTDRAQVDPFTYHTTEEVTP